MKEKYRPSNGTEGEMFMEKFCYRCIHEDGDENLCNILSSTFWHDVDDKESPPEWQYGKDGQPLCTKFEAVK